jgi:hypothetical protein
MRFIGKVVKHLVYASETQKLTLHFEFWKLMMLTKIVALHKEISVKPKITLGAKF